MYPVIQIKSFPGSEFLQEHSGLTGLGLKLEAMHEKSSLTSSTTNSQVVLFVVVSIIIPIARQEKLPHAE